MCFYIYSQKASIINSIDKQKYTDFQYSLSDCFKGEDLISPTYLLIEKSCPINFLEKNLRQQSIKFSCIKCFSVTFHKHLKEDQVLTCFFFNCCSCCSCSTNQVQILQNSFLFYDSSLLYY